MKRVAILYMPVAVAMVAAWCGGGLEVARARGADAPASTRSADDIDQEIGASYHAFLQKVDDPLALSDPAKRSQLAPELVPLAKKIAGDMGELAKASPERKKELSEARIRFLADLSALGDGDAAKELEGLAASKDGEESLNGQSGQIQARWLLANMNPAGQTAIVDEVEKLDAAHPESDVLTELTDDLADGAASPEIYVRLNGLALRMSSPYAKSLNEGVKLEQAVEGKLKVNEGKPAEIAGKGPDGKAFSTEAWKGKVILVDFWATWCGPCVAEMPRMKLLYNKYHGQGLEILGVSNDYSVETIKGFVAKRQIPWQQLYDAEAGASEKWNPTTVRFGIEGIPIMFLIDKKGTIRSVEARRNMEELIPKLLAE